MGVQPRLRSDIFLLPLKDGVYIRSGTTAFQLHGRGTYALLQRLAPFLDGRHSVDDLAAPLGDQHASLLRQLVAVLSENGIVRDASLDRAHSLSEADRSRYGAEIAVLAALGDSPEYRFERFRHAIVLVAGSGITCAAVALALMRLGLARCRLSLSGEAIDGDRLREQVLLLRRRDPVVDFEIAGDLSFRSPGDLAHEVAGLDFVVYAADTPDVERAGLLARACAKAQVASAHLMVAGQRGLIGPIQIPGRPGCWECSWLRMDETDRALLASATSRSPFLAPPSAGVIAGELAFDVFKLAAGHRPERAEKIVEIDLETLRRVEHEFVSHPHCISCRTLAPAGNGAGARLVDKRFGLINAMDEEDLPQIPLRAVMARVGGMSTVGVGVDAARARLVATLQACALHATSLLDLPLAGRELNTGNEVILPANTTLQVGYGSTREEALSRALNGHARSQTLEWIRSASPSCPRVELDASTLDPRSAALVNALDSLACGVDVIEASGPLKIPTFIAVADGFRCCRSHPVAALALAETLEQVVAWRQLRGVPGISFDEGELPEVKVAGRCAVPTGSPAGDWRAWTVQVSQALETEASLIEVSLDTAQTVDMQNRHVVAIARLGRAPVKS